MNKLSFTIGRNIIDDMMICEKVPPMVFGVNKHFRAKVRKCSGSNAGIRACTEIFGLITDI